MKKIIIILLITSLSYLAAYAAAKLAAKPKKIKPFVEKLPHFTVAGHRGAPAYFPENTIESFRKTLEIDPSALLEMDVWLTSDNIPVVHHDGTVDRKTGARGPVRGFTFSELRKLDAGYNITFDEGKTYPFRARGYKIPALEAVLKEFPRALISIDIKDHREEGADIVMKLVTELGAADHVVIGSFGAGVMKFVNREYPGITTAFSKNQVTAFFILQKLGLTGFFRSDGDVMMIPEFTGAGVSEDPGPGKKGGVRIITPGFVEAARELNIPVLAWTINRPENMKRLKGYGLRGIITDHPDILATID